MCGSIATRRRGMNWRPNCHSTKPQYPLSFPPGLFRLPALQFNIMKTTTLFAFAAVMFGISSPLTAGGAYQATGPIIELTDSKIVIQKDKEKWEFARTADTKVTGEMKVGSKVTILYTMAATSVEVKPPAKETPATTDKPAKGSDKSGKGSDKSTKKKASSGG